MTPRCPFCNIPGIDQLEAQPIGPGLALLIFCKNCGAIHGVVPISKKSKDTPLPAPEAVPPTDPVEPEPFQIKPLEDLEPTPKSDKPLTPQQAFLLQRQMIQKATAYKIFLSGIEGGEE